MAKSETRYSIYLSKGSVAPIRVSIGTSKEDAFNNLNRGDRRNFNFCDILDEKPAESPVKYRYVLFFVKESISRRVLDRHERYIEELRRKEEERKIFDAEVKKLGLDPWESILHRYRVNK